MWGQQKAPVIFGEVLFDIFPDGNAVLGGAPFNVAWHLQGFGLAPLFISRVGNDEAGTQVRAAMQAWGMDIRGLQQDERDPTGAVRVTVVDGKHDFEILPNQAYDNISLNHALEVINETHPALLYYGTLAARSPESATTLSKLRSHIPHHFVDINLRHPWWQFGAVARAVTGATWLKLNDEEVAALHNEVQLTDDRLVTLAGKMMDAYGFNSMIVTEGAKGAFILSQGEYFNAKPETVDNIKDTVGAGDALTSVVILGILLEWPPGQTLARAVEFAAALCQRQGATVNDPAFYSAFKQRWQIE